LHRHCLKNCLFGVTQNTEFVSHNAIFVAFGINIISSLYSFHLCASSFVPRGLALL
jgi:hypothetical protein